MTILEPTTTSTPDAITTRVRAERLTRRRGDHTLWTNTSFTVGGGRSLALTGPSGAGKSTLLNCIGLLDEPDGGSLELDGLTTSGLGRCERQNLFRTTIGHLFQNYGLVETWTVDRNLDVALTGRRLSRAERRRRREAALERVGLDGFGRRLTHSLSGGEQQRVALARLIIKQPTIVVADEPSAALDVDNVAMVLDVLGDLRSAGAAVIVATHDEAVADWCGDRLELGRKA